MKDKCSTCRYSVPVAFGDGDELMRACVYILRKGSRRPCPPGEACTVWEPIDTKEEAPTVAGV